MTHTTTAAHSEAHASTDPTQPGTQANAHDPAGSAPHAPDARKANRRLYKDDSEYRKMVARFFRSYGRRVEQADPTVLADMATMHAELEQAMCAAAQSLQAQGFSWADIGRELGIGRHAAMRRFGNGTVQARFTTRAGR